MGYRSDVGLCLTGTGRKELDRALQAAEQAKNPDLEEIRALLRCAKLRQHDESGAAAYYWEGLKWYPDYPDVGFFEAFMGHLDEIGSDDYLFIRVGESDDDTEYRGGFWENPLNMGLTRGITFDA